VRFIARLPRKTVREAFPHTVGFVYLGGDAVGFLDTKCTRTWAASAAGASALARYLSVVVLRSVRPKGG
jgi:hypothetical protein